MRSLVKDDWKHYYIYQTKDICKHDIPCNRNLYDLSIDPIDEPTAKNGSFVRIQLANPNVQFVEDSRSYDMQSLIGEVGGTLGYYWDCHLFLYLTSLTFC
jgi:hypothetical protein